MIRALAISLLLLSQAFSPLAHARFERGEKMKVRISDVRPTQFEVGMREVRLRQKAIEALKDNEDELKALMKEYRAMVVVGPGDQLYLVDGHHFTRTLHEAGMKKMYIRIERDWSDKAPREFWEKMREKGWVYLQDQSGKARSPSELPKNISKLGDDPYRSLAWFVRKANGYENLDVPFQEFKWADFFRERIPASMLKNDAGFEKAFQTGMKLARGTEAADLPGYLGPRPARKCLLPNLLLRIAR